MPTRQNISSGSPYEPICGFSRAVRIGNIVSVSGTAPIQPNGHAACVGDPAGQARRSLEIVSKALGEAGASLRDVIRTRVYLANIDDWQAVASVHGEFFRDIRPASTVLQVSGFIDSDWLVEIEAEAVVSD